MPERDSFRRVAEEPWQPDDEPWDERPVTQETDKLLFGRARREYRRMKGL